MKAITALLLLATFLIVRKNLRPLQSLAGQIEGISVGEISLRTRTPRDLVRSLLIAERGRDFRGTSGRSFRPAPLAFLAPLARWLARLSGTSVETTS